MNCKEDREILLQVGFTAEEIDHLRELRRYYSEEEMNQMSIQQRRLEFVRWLVITGKLTDQIA